MRSLPAGRTALTVEAYAEKWDEYQEYALSLPMEQRPMTFDQFRTWAALGRPDLGYGQTRPPAKHYIPLPRRDSLVIRRIEDEQIDQATDSMIAVPWTGELAQFAEVVLVGPRVEDPTLVPGTRVLLEKWSGNAINIHGVELLVITEEQIICVMQPEGEPLPGSVTREEQTVHELAEGLIRALGAASAARAITPGELIDVAEQVAADNIAGKKRLKKGPTA